MPLKRVLLLAFILTLLFLPQNINHLMAQTSGLKSGETLQTNPKSRPQDMTLTITDTEAPSTPTLIAPSNGSTLTTTTPSFVWEESSDNYSMSYYTLTLDGSALFSSIPLSDTSNGSYTLTKSGTQYTLVPVSALADGTHTWKITAVDINGNTADSETWSFTISTITPSPTSSVTATGTLTPTPEVTSALTATVTPVPTASPTPTLTQVSQLISQVPQVIKNVEETTGPIATALISGAIPLTATALLASQFGWGISLQILLRILQALGILPPPSPQGLVFNSDTEEPVPFAILNISKIGELNTSETVVTNTEGVYGGVQLPPGKYKIEVRHQDFAFPTVKSRPTYLTIFEFYKGEFFEVTNEKTKQLFLIPVDPLKKIRNVTKKVSWSLIRERLVRLSQYLLLPLFVVSLVITYIYPTFINMAVCLIYIVIITFRVAKWFKKPMIIGKVVDASGAPLENVFVRIFIQESNQLMSVLVTDKGGSFKAYLPKNEYQVSLSKQKYVWVENGKVQNFFLADARKTKVVVLAVMEDSQKLFKDLFN